MLVSNHIGLYWSTAEYWTVPGSKREASVAEPRLERSGLCDPLQVAFWLQLLPSRAPEV